MNEMNHRFQNPEHAEHITKSAENVGFGITVLHVVSAGMNFFPKSVFLSVAASWHRIYVTNAADVEQYLLVGTRENAASIDLRSFAPIPAGWKIVSNGFGASAYDCSIITGSEEAV